MLKNAETQSRILEVGFGNGHLLIELAKKGYSTLTGVDYSEKAVIFANENAKSKGVENIHFLARDIMAVDAYEDAIKYDFIIDKGTFDAISLCPDFATPEKDLDDCTSNRGRIPKVVGIYRNFIKSSIDRGGGGTFMITSCNWTREELLAFFEGDFSLKDELLHPTFTFGGITGSVVTTLVFKIK
jgi:SAM-dependent methyltransferase